MGLVKSITPEFFHEIKYLSGFVSWNTIFHCPLHETLSVLGHNLRYFLAHCLSEIIGLCHGKIGQVTCNLHNLLLINYNPVCLLQNRFQLWNKVFDCFFAVLPFHKIIHHSAIKRAWTIKSNQSDNIFKEFRP